MIAKLLREPLFQFLIIGAGIYLAYGLLAAEDPADDEFTVVVDDTRIQAFVSGWEGRMGRVPTQQELDGMIQQFVREEILYREAKAMGLGEDDPITRRRMAQKLEFLTKDIARLREPTPEELATHFQENLDDYRSPDRISFMHVFFDPDSRGDTTLSDAEAALQSLIASGAPESASVEVGDRYMLQSYFENATEFDVRRQLGSGFAESVMVLPEREWQGPVLSGYGVHLVYVVELEEAPEPVLADVEERVYDDWQLAQQNQFNDDYFAGLRSRYEVVIETDTSVATAGPGAAATTTTNDS